MVSYRLYYVTKSRIELDWSICMFISSFKGLKNDYLSNDLSYNPCPNLDRLRVT